MTTPAAAKARAQQLLEGDVMPDRGSVMLFFARPPRRLMGWLQRVRSLWAIVASDCRGRAFRLRTRAQDAPAAIYPLYFSCAADFEYLRLSIRSLTAHGGGHVGRIYVYEDRKQPFTDTQKLELASETDCPIAYRRTAAPMRWGVTLLHNELRAFLNLCRELAEHDFIVKVDSDVLFTAGWLFPAVLRGGANLVGQPVASLSTHSRRVVPDVQGGCYFLRVGAFPQLRSVPLLAAALRVARTSRVHLLANPRGPHDQPVGTRCSARDLYDRFLPPRPRAIAQQLAGDRPRSRRASTSDAPLP